MIILPENAPCGPRLPRGLFITRARHTYPAPRRKLMANFSVNRETRTTRLPAPYGAHRALGKACIPRQTVHAPKRERRTNALAPCPILDDVFFLDTKVPPRLLQYKCETYVCIQEIPVLINYLYVYNNKENILSCKMIFI